MLKTLYTTAFALSAFALSAQDVTTYAGTAGVSGFSSSSTQGLGSVKFNHPNDVFVDGKGNVWVADRYNNLLVMLQGNRYYQRSGDPLAYGYTDGVGVGSHLHSPTSVILGKGDTIIIADGENYALRKVSPLTTITSSQTLSSWVGGGTPGGNNQGAMGDKAGLKLEARMGMPTSLTQGTDGTIYFYDQGNNVIRKVTANGYMSTYAGTGAKGVLDAPVNSATFTDIGGLMWDAKTDILYFTERGNGSIRKIKDGLVSTVVNGFSFPGDLVKLNDSMVFVADETAITLFRLNRNKLETEFAGQYGNIGSQNGTGKDAQFDFIEGLAKLNDSTILIADGDNHLIRSLRVRLPKSAGTSIAPIQGQNPGLTIRNANGLLQIDGLTAPALSLTILSIDGRVMAEIAETNSSGLISTPNLTPGVYVLRCTVNGQQRWGKFAVR